MGLLPFPAMIVSGSTLRLTSSHASLECQRRQESLDAWRDGPNGRQRLQQHASSERLRMEADGMRVSLSQQALRPPAATAPSPAQSAPVAKAKTPTDDADASVEDIANLKVTLVRLLVEQITGRAMEVFDAGDLSNEAAQVPPELAEAASKLGTAQRHGAASSNAGWGATYTLEETRLESETTRFSAQGLVRTADGKEIALSLELSMSREFASQTRLSVRAGDALKDPLVINFGGSAAQLSQTTFKFDLDVDGKADAMRFVAPGSGFLALDRNGNGHIDDGSELFGATSGDGFADLSQYDDDGNGWIDERDAAFSRLRVWSRDGSGKDQLLGLQQQGVGALYLGKADTPFALKDGANQLQGAVRASGLYLREDGGAGTLQQLDLVV